MKFLKYKNIIKKERYFEIPHFSSFSLLLSLSASFELKDLLLGVIKPNHQIIQETSDVNCNKILFNPCMDPSQSNCKNVTTKNKKMSGNQGKK